MKTKTFLVILELNNVLFYLNNPRIKTVNSHVSQVPVTYDDNYNNLQISYRKGKVEFLNSLFLLMKQDIDVAVWSDLGNDSANDLCHKYFTRYYRDLLFILATNRGLYGDHPEHTSIKIRKDLDMIYNRFQGYNSTNTLVVTANPNLMEKHSRNDLKVPEYSPANPDFGVDPGMAPLIKYMKGLLMVQRESGISDITRFINAKQATNIFKRASHNLHTEIDYI